MQLLRQDCNNKIVVILARTGDFRELSERAYRNGKADESALVSPQLNLTERRNGKVILFNLLKPWRSPPPSAARLMT